MGISWSPLRGVKGVKPPMEFGESWARTPPRSLCRRVEPYGRLRAALEPAAALDLQEVASTQVVTHPRLINQWN